jgi:hypothetical protein
MALVPNKNQIDFLVRRRFPGVSLAPPPLYAQSFSRKQPDRLREAVEAYRATLWAMTPDEVASLYEVERTKKQEEERTRAAQEEQERFFNQPHAMADFDHWSKAAYWSLDEAAALSFGRAPEVVKWDVVKSAAERSPLAKQYGRLRDLMLRAKGAQQLYDPVLPGFYLAWAKRNEIAFPPDLEAAVVARGVQIADWKSSYDDLKEKYDETVGLVDWLNKRLLSHQEIQTELKAQIAELKAKSITAPPAERGLLGKERESVLKLIIGMAVKGYTYDPAAKRTETISEITSDLAELGLSLTDDTVRKWLKEAAELLPPPERQ